ncbi:MAG: phosphoglucosamine mutase, partial [Thermoanaerobaculia bacterium]
MRALFGTDGIRGEAGVPPLDAATVSKVGGALASSLGRPGVSVVVGCDTRISSESIVAALSGGLVANGGVVRFAGIVPTPAVAWLTQTLRADAGVSISASHNPWKDNGIKIFSAEGRKLPDAVEAAIERRIAAASATAPAETVVEPALARDYVTHLAGSLPHRLDGVRVVVDAAHGAAFEVAPAAFRAAGAVADAAAIRR